MSTSASLPVLHTTYTYTYSGTFMYGVLCMLVVFGGHRGGYEGVRETRFLSRQV